MFGNARWCVCVLYCQASTAFDELLHRVEVDATKVLVAMECSQGYTGPTISQYVRHVVVKG